MPKYNFSDAGLALTKQFEGLRLTAYQDQVGVWTIGYGHTGIDVMEGLTITEDHATLLLKSDVSAACTCVNGAVKVPLSQGEFDALVDFTFNLGGGSLLSSTLLRLLNEGKHAEAAAQFPRWNRAGGVVVAGLTRRRKAEQAMFLSSLTQPLAPAVVAARSRLPIRSIQ